MGSFPQKTNLSSSWEQDLRELARESIATNPSSITCVQVLYHIRCHAGITSLPNECLEMVIQEVVDAGYQYDGMKFEKKKIIR